MVALPPVLLVDDDFRDVEIMTYLLERAIDNPVHVARDGQEALDYLLQTIPPQPRQAPAVVLLDLKMPRVDGAEVLERMKRNVDLKRVPVVMMTGSTLPEELERCYALGANAFVSKPTRLSSLVDGMSALGRFWTLRNRRPGPAAVGH